ncbi:MAG: TetR/AcrR family transcriptional regulator [Aureispira sp.]
MKHSQIRQTIVETAANLFYQNGYNSTGINEIIAKAGIAKATLYNHFKSKEAICLAYLQFKNVTFVQQLQAFFQRYPKGEAQLLALFDFLTEFFEDRDFNGCWCIKTVAEIPKDNQVIKTEIQGQKRQLIVIIQQLVQASFPQKEADQQQSLAQQIYLLYEAAVSESHLHQASWPITTSQQLCAQILTAAQVA